MAEVRQCAGRGANDFALKLFFHYHLRSQSRHGISALHVSSLSAGVLLDDIKTCRQNGVESGDNRMLVEVCQDTKRLLETGLEKENDRDSYCGVQQRFCSSRLRIQHTGRKVSRYQSCDKYRRTLSNFFYGHHSFQHCLYRGFGSFDLFREYSSNGARPEPLYRTKTGYYDVLGVSPTATQAQIKTAYYKQAFLFHPDRNAGREEATGRFSEISEAYTVLGNKGLRKKYDRGLLSPSDLTAPGRPSAKDTGGSAKPHTESRRFVSSVHHRVFDFDEFYKNHYSEQLQRQKLIRAKREEMLKRKQDFRNKTPDRAMEIGVVMLLILAMGILYKLEH